LGVNETTLENVHIKTIAETVADYQGGGVMTRERILQWVEQFDAQDHEVILSEMSNILKKTYVSKEIAKQFLASLFDNDKIVENFVENYSKVAFLNIQQGGQSQKELLQLFDEVLVEKFGIYTEECGKNPELSKYIYIDDCFFTGNKLYWDIKRWIDKAKPNTALHVILFGLHDLDFNYRHGKLVECLAEKNISINFWRVI
jgi:hypothetical protein